MTKLLWGAEILDFLGEILGLFFPKRCPLCGVVMQRAEQGICIECRGNLPLTYNWLRANNGLTEMFAGRVPLRGASALMYYGAGGLAQKGVHSFKYHDNRDVAYLFGAIYGRFLVECGRFNQVDMLVPVPLHRWRFWSRGYNQSEIFCRGMASQMGIEVQSGALRRVRATKKQALRKGRVQRWRNVEDAFLLVYPEKLLGRKVMIVDDVITTGSTLEACVRAISDKLPQIDVWVGCCAVAGRGPRS